jgi:ADP-heptose:LPS heptosyltransferase
MVSNINNKSIFDFDERLKFIGIDFNSKEKKIFLIAKKVKVVSGNINFNGIYDLHDVIRSKILCLMLSSKTEITRVFEKQRGLKNKIINKKIGLQKLKTSSERYLNCLKKDFEKLDFSNISKSLEAGTTKKDIIGIAPFSAHKSKIWPLSNYQKIINHFKNYNFVIFAFGSQELEDSKTYFLKNSNCSMIDRNLNLNEQMELINGFKVFISMDSANMHLASLTSTKVVSVWGPTHPFLGFRPLFNEEFIVQLSNEEFNERPISIYGKIRKKDKVKAEQSMSRIDPERVIEKINFAINQ